MRVRVTVQGKAMESRKQAVSIRMSSADIRSVKKLAKRLSVRDSDVVRFAVKTMLAQFSPLCDSTIRGRELVPILAEHGSELCRHFDLDVGQLEAIVNDNAEDGRRVDRDDIQLIAMTHLQRSYLGVRLYEQAKRQRSGVEYDGDSYARQREPLQAYLYEKYLTDAPKRSPRADGEKLV
jgi:hypothetical protein